MEVIQFLKKYATIIREFKDDYMKVNYPERIDATARELKIILSQQRTITNRQKIQTLYWLKSGLSQSVTDVAERLGVHRVTVQRWLKQYSAGGLSSLLKIRQSTGRPLLYSNRRNLRNIKKNKWRILWVQELQRNCDLGRRQLSTISQISNITQASTLSNES